MPAALVVVAGRLSINVGGRSTHSYALKTVPFSWYACDEGIIIEIRVFLKPTVGMKYRRGLFEFRPYLDPSAILN